MQRAAAEDGRATGVRADAYYFSPQGRKLRSLKEVEVFCKCAVATRVRRTGVVVWPAAAAPGVGSAPRQDGRSVQSSTHHRTFSVSADQL